MLLSTDLFFASRIKGAAEAAGLEISMGKSIENATLKDDLAFVVVDLATTGSTLDQIADIVRKHSNQTRLVAFGPHVQSGRLDAARQAGFDAVLTRGQLDRHLGQLFETD
ncbi:MAG: histidine kinase [Pirellulaceae bacterium]